MDKYLCMIQWDETEVYAKGELIKELPFLPRKGMFLCISDDDESIMTDPGLTGEKDEPADHIPGEVTSVEYWEGTEDAVDANGNTICVPFTIKLKPSE